MTTYHHRVKTHAGWQVRQPFPGIYLWQSPHGSIFLVDHTGTRQSDAPDATARPPHDPRLPRQPSQVGRPQTSWSGSRSRASSTRPSGSPAGSSPNRSS